MAIVSNLEDLLAGLGEHGAERPGVLALDVSKRAIGVAGADAGWRLATPLATIRRKRQAHDLEQLRAIVRKRQAGALIVGWPLNMDGSPGPRCQSVRAFAETLEAALGLPILLWDERLSTFTAKEAATHATSRRAKRSPDIDALAAATILQDALDALARCRSRPNR